MFKHTIFSKTVTIDASAEEVWQVLTDFDSYPQWNPFTTRVVPKGQFQTGNKVDLHVHMPIRGDRISVETVECIEPAKQIAWGMTMGHTCLLKARRDQLISPINDTQCTYQTWDAFRGLLTPLVVKLFGKDMQNGFNGVADALKARCETLNDELTKES